MSKSGEKKKKMSNLDPKSQKLAPKLAQKCPKVDKKFIGI
jgi:hypothetical protein